MPVAPGGAKEFAANLTQTTVKLAAIPGGIFAHRSGGEDEFVAEGSRDGASGFEQSFQMRFGSLLESKGGLATVAPVCVAAGQQGGFGNPHAIFILTELHFREWNDHSGHTLARFVLDVKEDGLVWTFSPIGHCAVMRCQIGIAWLPQLVSQLKPGWPGFFN
jgi:hypothetical protein